MNPLTAQFQQSLIAALAFAEAKYMADPNESTARVFRLVEEANLRLKTVVELEALT